jgi:hypothetical protein
MSKQIAIENIQNRANLLLTMAGKLEAMIPDNLPNEAEIWATEHDLRINLPFSLCLFKQVRKLLGRNWKRHRSFSNDQGRKFIIYLAQDKTDLTICLEPEHENATCQRLQVGTKEIPIYRVTCN